MQQSELDAYLARIEWRGEIAPRLDVLVGLHEAHMLAVPFENLDIHVRREILLDSRLLYDKIVLRRRGGFCYELNGAFAMLLRAIGFDLDMLSARVANAQGVFGPDFDHMALIVRIGGKRWLADVGFGDSFRRPLDLDDAEPQSCGDPLGRSWFVRRLGGELGMCQADDDGSVLVKYLFTLEPRTLFEYAPMCVYQQTSPDSHFTRQRICSVATREGRKSLTDSALIVTTCSGRDERPVAEEQRATVLREEFGVVV